VLQTVSAFKGPEFRKLLGQWNKKLEKDGFTDIEYKGGWLKKYDRRTQAFTDQEMVFEFFYQLDHFLSEHESDQHLPPEHQRILHFYASGMHITKIAEEIEVTTRTIRRIISVYKQVIIDRIVSANPPSCSGNVFEIRNDELKLDN
jgi:hypothetical protein